MATKTLSQASQEKAFALSLQLPRLNVGRSKVNGVEFYVVPGSEVGTAHWTAKDARGCTCKGHRRYGNCSHVEAVRIHLAGERAARKPERRSEYQRMMDRHLVDAF